MNTLDSKQLVSLLERFELRVNKTEGLDKSLTIRLKEIQDTLGTMAVHNPDDTILTTSLTRVEELTHTMKKKSMEGGE